jgi:hypothetical protein
MKQNILPLRQQANIRNQWLRQRLDQLMPELMARENFDMWLVIAREYNEDPLIITLLPEPEMAARRRTILVFARNNDGRVDRLTLSRYGQPGFYESGWNPNEETQQQCLARIVRQRDPQRIGLNFSPTYAFGDGLSLHEYQRLGEALGSEWMNRTASAERLCVGWLERRIEPELIVYPGIVAIGHTIIAEAFSSSVIHPGLTTTEDVVWWMRQTMQDMGLHAWFQPTIEIQAPGQPFDPGYSEESEKRKLILPGDLLHCDMGFIYLGLATDQQQHGYVLKPGETEAPEGLKAALAAANRVQEIHLAAMQIALTGNEVLAAVRQQAEAESIAATIYSHPLGYHGHAAGPTIGLWDQQGGVPGRGDYPLFDDTAYSIELNIQQPVPEWENQIVRIALEEDAILSGGKMRWLAGRQTALHLIG